MNERFCQIRLFSNNGLENLAQFVIPAGQVMFKPVIEVTSNWSFSSAVTPADCGQDAWVVPAGLPVLGSTQVPVGALVSGAPRLWMSTPEEARLSLLAMVLLMMETLSASSSEIPAPSQPATLLTMMLLVIEATVPVGAGRSLTVAAVAEQPVALLAAGWEGGDIGSVDLLETDTAAGAALSRVGLDEVGVDRPIRAGAVAESRRAIGVVLSAANRIGVGRAHDHESAAVGGNGGVGALVEDDRVVLDVAVADVSDVSDTAALTGAQVSADPVVLELVVVVTGAEADATAARQGCGEELVAERGVGGDVVVMDVDVHVQASRQELSDHRADCWHEGGKSCVNSPTAGWCLWPPSATRSGIHPGRR